MKQKMISSLVIKKILSVYGIAYLVLLVFVLGLQYFYPKTELHMLLNSHHTGIQDTFFKYYSMLAEWPLYVLALLPILWKKIKISVFFGLCELSGGAIIQILKHIFSFDRPASVFENSGSMILPVVEGVDLYHCSSFPSGHAFTFFTFCTCCALILAYRYKLREGQNNHTNWILLDMSLLLLLTLAILGCYSRIYLSQHFLSDVCVGSIIGFVIPCLMFHICRNKILKLNKG